MERRKNQANEKAPASSDPQATEQPWNEKVAKVKGQQPRAYQDIIDDTLDDSFPASDPPSWAGQ